MFSRSQGAIRGMQVARVQRHRPFEAERYCSGFSAVRAGLGRLVEKNGPGKFCK